MERIKHYIDVLSKKKYKKDYILSFLADCPDLDDDRKNLIYFYLQPRPLLDMELPSRIFSYRGPNTTGYLSPNITETGLLLEAYRTPQYNRFMRHLLHSFTNPDEVFPLLGHNKCECGLCKRDIWAYGAWDGILDQYPDFAEGERNQKRYLAFACDQSQITLCLPCLIQLLNLNELLKIIEGDNYLDWRINVWDKKVRTRFPGPNGMDSDNI